MRTEPNLKLDRYRLRTPGSDPGANWGAFAIGPLRIISSGVPGPEGENWEHVSVSCATRCPTWDEMASVKNLFWRDDETVVQFHPRKDQHVNLHPFCLHLWKRVGSEYELPPRKLLA